MYYMQRPFVVLKINDRMIRTVFGPITANWTGIFKMKTLRWSWEWHNLKARTMLEKSSTNLMG